MGMSLAQHDEAMRQAESIPSSHQSSYCEALQAGLKTLVLRLSLQTHGISWDVQKTRKLLCLGYVPQIGILIGT